MRPLPLAITLAMTAVAARADSPLWCKFRWENDVVFRPDRYYTNGLGLDFWRATERPDWMPEWGGFFPQEGAYQTGWAIGQHMYTSSDIGDIEPGPGDRPYAGWLYGAWSLQHTGGDEQATTMHELRVRAGVVGPGSGAEQTQDWFHDEIHDERAAAWHTQMPNEPTLDVRVAGYRLLSLLESGHGAAPRIDLVPHLGADVGTTFVQAFAGARLRLGEPVEGGAMGSDLIAPAKVGEVPRQPGPALVALGNVFAGVEGRAVAHNTLLDGTWWHDSRSVDREPLVGEVTAGAEGHVLGRLGVRFTLAWRGDEFESQEHRHAYGSLAVWCRL